MWITRLVIEISRVDELPSLAKLSFAYAVIGEICFGKSRSGLFIFRLDIGLYYLHVTAFEQLFKAAHDQDGAKTLSARFRGQTHRRHCFLISSIKADLAKRPTISIRR